MQKQQLRDQLKQAMLAKDTEKTAILRLLLSALNYYEINKGGAGYEATSEDVMTVIQKEAKQRRDSIEQFQAAGRQDLVEKEQKELIFLESYLPQQMSEDEIRTLVKAVIAETKAATSAEMGKVMGRLVPETKGKADGALVSRIVKEELAKG